ncbi:MAG: hypothetical protein JXQ27_07770 [Acidobacteria bacterium]|nr:hypothetical protein [Acidobacteriota bacterium]
MTGPSFKAHYCPIYTLNGIRFEATYQEQKYTFLITRDALDLLPGAKEEGGQIAFERNLDLIHQTAIRIITTSSPLSDKHVICIGPGDMEKVIRNHVKDRNRPQS